jgi:hypothetical protein
MRSNRNAFEKRPKKFIIPIIAIVVICAIVAIYFGCRAEEEVETTGIQTVDVEQSHFDLLFNHHGEVSFSYVGRQARVYIAHYEYDELVLHELVGSVGFLNVEEFSGNMFWGITKNGDLLDELRIRINIKSEESGGVLNNYYLNFAPFNFEYPPTVINPTIDREPVERGERYVFHVRQTGYTWWLDDDWFDPEVLADNEQTVLLYIVFD